MTRITRMSRFATRFILFIAAAGIAAAPAPAGAADERFGLEAAPWMQSLEGEMAIGTGTTDGTMLQLDEGLGLEPEETTGIGRLWLRWGRVRFVFDYASAERSGTQTLDQDVDFRGLTFAASEQVLTELDLTLYRADVDVALIDSRRLKVGLTSALNLGDVTIAMEGATAGRESLDRGLFFPTFGAFIAANPVGGFGIRGEASGLALSISDDDVSVIDARAQVEYYFLERFGILAGYRHYQFDVDADAFGIIRNSYTGPYAGIGLRL